MSTPSNARLIRILQDRLENRDLESSDLKEALLDSLSDEQRELLGEAMMIGWEEGYDEGESEGGKAGYDRGFNMAESVMRRQ